MASIVERKTKDGRSRWLARVKKRGHELNRTFRTKREAEAWARDRETEIEHGDANLEYLLRERRTLQDVAAEYLERIYASSPKARRRREDLIAWWMVELSQKTPARKLVHVKRNEIERILDRLVAHDGLTVATRNRYLAGIRHMMRWAVRQGYLGVAPTEGIPQLREKHRERFLSDEERRRLASTVADSADDRLELLFKLAITTGARNGELMALRWNRVDLKRCLLHLQETKNHEPRDVEFPDVLVPLFEKRREEAGGDPYVFAPIDKKRRCDGPPKFPYPAWRSALSEADVEDFRFHDLRHTFATYITVEGASQFETKEVLGHRSLAATQRYVHMGSRIRRSVTQQAHLRALDTED